MCGIGGILNSATPLEAEAIRTVARHVNYRGPDSTGIALFNEELEKNQEYGVHALFFNRLAIIDLDPRANQPFEDDRYTLIFNGEIYNFKELRNILKGQGVTFHTTSDTEVLFRALKVWGIDTLRRLNGMFAFFWIDRQEHYYILARDRVGIKPIYYRLEGNSLLFASELHSIVRLSRKKPGVAPESIENYFCLQYVPTPGTILEGIQKLPPGTSLSGNLKNLEIGRSPEPVSFWDAYAAKEETRAFSQDEFEQILVDSVRDQMEADVPVGLFLSSGVDSSLLTAIISKHFHGRAYDFFTVAYNKVTRSDESQQALTYLNGFRNPDLKHHALELNSTFVASKLARLYCYYDEPFGDHAALLNWAISEKAREHVIVALSGDGADEMFWGYGRYRDWQLQRNEFRNRTFLTPIARKLLQALPGSRLTYTALNKLESDPVTIYFNQLRPRLFGFLNPVEKKTGVWFTEEMNRIRDRADFPSMVDLRTYLPDAMLYKVDRSSMACSLEVRVPYLDNRVIDYSLQLSLDQKSTSEYGTKAPLKALLKTLAPHYDVSRPKQGFNFPLTEWMQKGWQSMIRDTLTKGALEDLGLPTTPWLDIVKDFYKGEKAGMEVWYLFNLVLWHKTFKAMMAAS